ncbi:hypothetical protein V8B97DRAFT_2103205 [Scleroderma yunnanense]
MALQSRPEPMNASPHHSKVKVTVTLSDPIFVAGGIISGKMEVESRADLDCLLGIGVMMVELYAIEEIISRDHTATSTFIHSRRIFQGPGLPPSNAVYSDHVPAAGEPLLPAHHYAARRGLTTFFFRFPLPRASPSSIKFGPASIRYEVRASASVAWQGDRRLVTDNREVKVVECLDTLSPAAIPQAVTIAEDKRLWVQASITNGAIIGGEAACIDLEVKNYTSRWTCGITLTLTRTLRLSSSLLTDKHPPDISDVITRVEFRGPEYSLPPGIEGIASLVVDVPRHSRGTKGNPRFDDNGKSTDSLFEVRCAFNIRVEMPPGSGDVVLDLPATVYHSVAVPEVPVSPPATASPLLQPYISLPTERALPSPPALELLPYYIGNHDEFVWSPQPPYDCLPPALSPDFSVYPWLPSPYPYVQPMQRSTSTGPQVSVPYYDPDLPMKEIPSEEPSLLPAASSPRLSYYPAVPQDKMDPVYYADAPAKGSRASRISHNLHHSTRHRSVSPCSRKHALPAPPVEASSLLHTQIQSISVSALPNLHESPDVVYSPRPMPSPKHSFSGSVPKSNNVSMLERMADEVGKQTSDLSADLPKGDAGVTSVSQAPILELHANMIPPDRPVLSGKDKVASSQRHHADKLLSGENMLIRPSSQASSDNFPRAPPTPPIAAITPVKFPRGPVELSGLGASLGKHIAAESGLDALEKRLVAEVGTRRLDTDTYPDVRGVVRPITIPPREPLDGVNDSAISSLTLADRDAIVKGLGREGEHEHDRDSDERTQHVENGQMPSDDERDVHTQKGKSVRRGGKSKHSDEDHERVGRRRERKKCKNDDTRKLRKEAQGRVAEWLGGIDTTPPPAMDDSISLPSPSAPHFVPLAESESFESPPLHEGKVEERRSGPCVTAKDGSAAPNPRSSGFVTVSSLVASQGSPCLSYKQSPRRSSANDLPKASSPHLQANTRPLPDVCVPSTNSHLSLQGCVPVSKQVDQSAFRLPRLPLRAVEPEEKYNGRSARGGRGGKVAQVASLWAAKATEAAAKKLSEPPSGKSTPNILKQPAKKAYTSAVPINGSSDTKHKHITEQHANPAKATTVPAVISSSHAIPMLSSTASLARPHIANKPRVSSLTPMISETTSDVKNAYKSPAPKTGRQLGDLAFGKARLKALIQKYQG